MSACSKIFERIKLPTELYEVHLLEWITPLSKNESLADYVDRFSKYIKHPEAIIIGVSFGGIIAQELGQKFINSKVIIISSIKHQNELSLFLKFLKATKLYKLYPIHIIPLIEKSLLKYGSKQIKRTIYSYQKYLPIRSKTYTIWAIKSFLNWCSPNTKVIHFHGNKDVILPFKYINKSVVIKNGTHAMIITKSSTIQSKLIKAMA